MQRRSEEIFTIVPHIFLNFLTRIVQTFARTHTYIEIALEVYQTIRSMVIRKGIGMAKKKFVEKNIGTYLEHGFLMKTYRSDPPNHLGIKFEPRGGSGFMHFDGLQEYIENFTRVEALSFDKLDYLFRIYCALLTVIFFVNMAHFYVKKTGFSGCRIRLRRTTRRKLAVFTNAFLRKLRII